MSNDLKFTQEWLNLILDLRDIVNKHSRTINQLADRCNTLTRKNDELEAKILKHNTNVNFNDIFGGFNGSDKK